MSKYRSYKAQLAVAIAVLVAAPGVGLAAPSKPTRTSARRKPTRTSARRKPTRTSAPRPSRPLAGFVRQSTKRRLDTQNQFTELTQQLLLARTPAVSAPPSALAAIPKKTTPKTSSSASPPHVTVPLRPTTQWAGELAPAAVKKHLIETGDVKPQASGPEGAAHWALRTRKKGAKTIVFFHGAGQPTNNVIVHRLASALKSQGVRVNLVSFPWADHGKAAKKFIANQRDGSVCLAAHSAGGKTMRTLADKKSLRSKVIGMVSINAFSQATDQHLPTLILSGIWDIGQAKPGARAKNVLSVGIESDHSLRRRPNKTDDKAKADYSAATWLMNIKVANLIGAFLVRPSIVDGPRR